LTACVWARALLQDEYGVKPSDILWVRGGMEHPGRPEKIPLELPADIRIETAPQDVTLSQMLERGEIDGIVGPRAPSLLRARPARSRLALSRSVTNRGRVFPHERDFFRSCTSSEYAGNLRPKIPGCPWRVFKAFDEAKRIALARSPIPRPPR